jgi:hypothetical protein
MMRDLLVRSSGPRVLDHDRARRVRRIHRHRGVVISPIGMTLPQLEPWLDQMPIDARSGVQGAKISVGESNPLPTFDVGFGSAVGIRTSTSLLTSPARDPRRARELLRIGVDHDPGNRVRFRLAGGANRIRTCSPTSRLVPLTLGPTTGNLCGASPNGRVSRSGTEGLRRQKDAAAATRRA